MNRGRQSVGWRGFDQPAPREQGFGEAVTYLLVRRETGIFEGLF